MRVSKLVAATGYPHVHDFIEQLLDMQFADVRAMLQLPRLDVGIAPGCNFAIAATLCNLLSGISSTIYMPDPFPPKLDPKRASGYAFKKLVTGYYPYQPHPTDDYAQMLYDFCRNSLSHSAALVKPGSPTVNYTRVFDQDHQDRGWSDKELTDLERPGSGFRVPYQGLQIQAQALTIHCDAFYFDVIGLLRKLVTDAHQMQAAEARFAAGQPCWQH
jgi:hypothetical protein